MDLHDVNIAISSEVRHKSNINISHPYITELLQMCAAYLQSDHCSQLWVVGRGVVKQLCDIISSVLLQEQEQQESRV